MAEVCIVACHIGRVGMHPLPHNSILVHPRFYLKSNASSFVFYLLETTAIHFSTTWLIPGVHKCQHSWKRRTCKEPTLWWGIVVRICVALTAVFHQEAGVVPGHAEDAIRLVKEHMGQHSPMAVHDNNLTISSAKENLKITKQTWIPSEVSDWTVLRMHLSDSLLCWKWIESKADKGFNWCHNRTLQPIKDVHNKWSQSGKIKFVWIIKKSLRFVSLMCRS